MTRSTLGHLHLSSCRVTPQITCKMMTRPKKSTGGGGDNDGSRNNDDDSIANRARTYNIGMLKRMYYAQPEVTHVALVSAMSMRWGEPMRACVTQSNDSIVVRFTNEHPNHAELAGVVRVLNRYQVGSQFVDYIKFESSVRDPRFLEEYVVSLNIPLISSPRSIEWYRKET